LCMSLPSSATKNISREAHHHSFSDARAIAI
jgi:hypothetical protein